MDIQSVDEVSVGMEVTESFTFSESDMITFSELVADDAPVHCSVSFARERGFSNRLVFGFLVAARFSGLLGKRLPGPHSVLQTVTWKNVKPVYVGETIVYTVRVKQVAASVKAVVLDLLARNERGETVLTGTSQCGFRR